MRCSAGSRGAVRTGAAPVSERDDAVVVIYDGDCAFCTAAARWLERRDHRRRLRLEPIADVVEAHGCRLQRDALEDEMHVVDPAGRVHSGFRGWRRIAREVPVLRPLWLLFWLPGARLIGDPVYRWVAGHRSWLSRLIGFRRRRAGDGG
jgi:predicted DCC family thiol-disulfide oxidoreductase YuxK